MANPPKFQMSGRMQMGGGNPPRRPGNAPDPNAWSQHAIRAARNGNAEKLKADGKRMAAAFPGHLGVLQAMAEIMVGLGDIKSAEVYAKQMIKAAPNAPMPYVVHATILMKNYRNQAALEALKRAEARAGSDPEVLSYIGHFVEKTGDMNEALRLFKRVEETKPDDAQNLKRIASMHRFLGNLDEAETYCDKALVLKPDDHYTYYLRSGLKKQKPERNHTDETEMALARAPEGHEGRIHLGYALAKEYEDIGDYDKSFHHLSTASRQQRAKMDYDVSVDLRTMEEIKQNFGRDYFNIPREGHPAPDPIFVIGMPRTGTTLVERIIGSHSEVLSLGELGIFGREMVKSAKSMVGTRFVAPEDRVKLTSEIDMRSLGLRYIQGVRERRGKEPYFIDKLPYNYLNIGPIHAALPNAKIVRLERHPMDTCYAIYKQLFGTAYPFSYTFEELGAYYTAYRSIIDHWDKVLPKGAVLKVKYEDVVADQVGQTKRIFEHCGLDWEDQVTEFYKSDTASTTASAAQVRQPVYKSSVAKWRHFERHLEPLRDILHANGIKDLD